MPPALEIVDPLLQRTVGLFGPGRLVLTLSGTESLEGFLAEARLQERGNWRAAYEALTVINWVRAGYDLAAVGLPAAAPQHTRPRGGRLSRLGRPYRV